VPTATRHHKPVWKSELLCNRRFYTIEVELAPAAEENGSAEALVQAE
jgi:hypothetical protein